MSIVKSSAMKAAAGATSANELPMLTPEQVIEQLRALEARMPDLVHLPPNRTTRNIKRIARLNVAFAREAFAVVGASTVVQEVIGNTPDELHQAEDEMARWNDVESELNSLLVAVAAANVVRRQRIARAALHAYNVSRELVKEQQHAHLLPHVQRMKRLPKFGRRRGTPAEPAPAAPPTPQTPQEPQTQTKTKSG